MEKFRKLLPVILAVLLIAALGVAGWLFAERAALSQRVTALERDLAAARQETAAVQTTLAGTQGELSDVSGQLTASESTVTSLAAELAAAQTALAETQATLAATETALADMTAARDASDAACATLTAELADCQAQLDAVTAEKETADAALAALGFTRVQPPVVESLPEEDAAEDAPADAPAEDEVIADAPTAEETGEEAFSDAPAEEVVTGTAIETMAYTVYTADALHIAFEAPVEWIIVMDEENSDTTYALRSQDQLGGAYTQLTIKAAGAPEDDLATYMAQEYGAPSLWSEPVELLGHAGLCAEATAMSGEGVITLSRIWAVVVDGTLYTIEISAAPECFDAAVDTVFLPVCASLRLIP